MLTSTLAVFVALLQPQAEPWIWTASGSDFKAEGSTPKALPSTTTVGADDHGIILIGDRTPYVVSPRLDQLPRSLPETQLTAEAWVSIDLPATWGGIISAVMDNAHYEQGWVLGYNQKGFNFALASHGTDDGDGSITYLNADRPYELGRWHHVVGTYDGQTMRLYVDGELAGQTNDQHGRILYDPSSPLALGGYLDSNEDNALDGRLRRAAIHPRVLSADEVAKRFRAEAHLNKLPPKVDTELDWLVAPFLTWPTTDAVSIMAEATRPTAMHVFVRNEDNSWSTSLDQQEPTMLHEFRVTGLEPHTKYFYQVVATIDDEEEPQRIESPLLSFRTAADRGDAFTFVAIGDTQAQPQVVKRVSDLAYETRPNVVIHAGDLVTTGSDKSHWTDHFFPNMQPLISRVPMMPVLGNHEQDAPHYYDYMSLPDPERWYTFSYGDADFFMIDGNRDLSDQSRQLAWLAKALEDSDAQWKFAVLHQPPWTSDSNDYGDTYEGPSHRGDPNARNITRLLEKYGVDICFSGHVHDYERTFPLVGEEVVPWDEGGVIYVTCAGGGGTLEAFDPANTWFGHRKERRHHFVYVALHGGLLEFQAMDEDGRLFDVMTLDKRQGRRLTSSSE